jgi:hypothetical protein
MGEKKNWFWIVYAIFALYILDRAFAIITIPASILVYEKWIFVVIGVLLILSAYRSYKKDSSAILI